MILLHQCVYLTGLFITVVNRAHSWVGLFMTFLPSAAFKSTTQKSAGRKPPTQ